MRNLETRVKRLEEMQPAVATPPGLLSVNLTELLLAVAFRLHGFYLAPLGGPRPGVPRICVTGLDFSTVLSKVKRMAALHTKLKGLDRGERERVSAKHGYRIIYPPANISSSAE